MLNQTLNVLFYLTIDLVFLSSSILLVSYIFFPLILTWYLTIAFFSFNFVYQFVDEQLFLPLYCWFATVFFFKLSLLFRCCNFPFNFALPFYFGCCALLFCFECFSYFGLGCFWVELRLQDFHMGQALSLFEKMLNRQGPDLDHEFLRS